MEYYPYQQILRATPDGAIVKLNARTMYDMVDDSRRDAEKTGNAIRAAKILMGAAREALANGYIDAASGLYHEAAIRLEDYANSSYSHAGRELHYRCAEALDRIYRRVTGREPKIPELVRVKGFYMSMSVDYEYTVLHIDNDDRFRRVMEYCRRHGLK